MTVRLADLPSRHINPCCQALMWAARHLPETQRFVVVIGEADTRAIDVPRRPLEVTYDVWRLARAGFASMPSSTFLAILGAARLTVEHPRQAAQATAWFALDDAVRAFDDAHAHPLPGSPAQLCRRIDVCSAALQAAIGVLPQETNKPLRRVAGLVTVGLEALTATAQYQSPPARIETIERQIRDLHRRWPIPTVLPSLTC